MVELGARRSAVRRAAWSEAVGCVCAVRASLGLVGQWARYGWNLAVSGVLSADGVWASRALRTSVGFVGKVRLRCDALCWNKISAV